MPAAFSTGKVSPVSVASATNRSFGPDDQVTGVVEPQDSVTEEDVGLELQIQVSTRRHDEKKTQAKARLPIACPALRVRNETTHL